MKLETILPWVFIALVAGFFVYTRFVGKASASDVHALVANGATLLDVRSVEELAGPDGRVSGSLSIPLPELDARLEELPRDKPVVVLCHSGSRSSLATQLLLKAGRPLVANLRGGLSRWTAEGYPIETSSAS
jgi:rhodanese-related sulfurtransferase